MSNNIDLKGRFAVVTGGAQGIGRAIVERFLASGAAVAIWDRDAALAKKTAGEVKGRVEVVPVDVRTSTPVLSVSRFAPTRSREGCSGWASATYAA